MHAAATNTLAAGLSAARLGQATISRVTSGNLPAAGNLGANFGLGMNNAAAILSGCEYSWNRVIVVTRFGTSE